MKKIHKAIFLIIGILTLVLIEFDPVNSIGVIKMVRENVKGISFQTLHKAATSSENIHSFSSNFE